MKFYTLLDHAIRLSAIVAVSSVHNAEHENEGHRWGFDVHFDAVESWYIGYEHEQMATAQRAKLMDHLEEDS